MGFSLFSTFIGIFTVQLVLVGIGIIGFDVAFAVANQLENNHTKGSSTADGGNGSEMEIPKFSPQYLKIGGPPPQGINVYYGEEDGLCGWWNGTAYEHSKLEFVDPISVQCEYEEGMSDQQGEKDYNFCHLKFNEEIMQPACGEQWYSNLKLCAMTQFYQNEEPKPKEGDEKDLMLVLMDGCLICKSGEAGNVQLALVNEWPKGSAFSNCTKEQRKPDWFNVAMGPDNKTFASQFTDTLMPDLKPPTPDEKDKYYSASFAFPHVLYQRRCDGIFSADPKVKIYTGVKLLVKHSCGGGNGSTMEVNLGDIDPGKFKNNMVELRGMMLILDEGKWLQFQYRRENATYWGEEDLKEMEADGKDQQGKPIYDNAKEKGKKRRRN